MVSVRRGSLLRNAMFLLARRSLSAFSTIWTFSTGFFYNIFGLLRALTTGFRQSVTPITLQHAWPLTEQQIYRRSHNFFGSVDEDAIRALGTQHHIKSLQCEIKARYRGSFNGCFVLEFTDGSTRVVRLPLDPAVQDAWDKVRSEVCTMQSVSSSLNLLPQPYSNPLFADTSDVIRTFLFPEYMPTGGANSVDIPRSFKSSSLWNKSKDIH